MSHLNFIIENNIIKTEKEERKENCQNLGSILFNALSKHGQKIAQIEAETGLKRTFNELKNYSVRCALWLKKQGFGPNDIIGICSPNQLDETIPYLAIFYVGAVYTPWNHNIDLEIAHNYMRAVKPKLIFACESVAKILQEAAKLENHSLRIITFGKHPDFESLEDIMSQQTQEEVDKFLPTKICADSKQMGLLIFTSGTTSHYKAAIFSHRTWAEYVLLNNEQADDVLLWYAGFSWGVGSFFTPRALVSGSTAVIHSTFGTEETCKVIDKYKVTDLYLMGRELDELYLSGMMNKYDYKSLKHIYTVGGKLTMKVCAGIQERYPHIRMLQTYGLTETGGPHLINDGNCKSMDSVGHVCYKNVEVKVVDTKTGEALGPNKRGEIYIKARDPMIGYHKNPEATRQMIDEEGWIHTGDQGYYDEDGEFFVTGRLSEFIKYKNQLINPFEIEQLLLSHPAVMEVAVVQAPHDVDGERPVAFVRKIPGAEVTEEELINFCATRGDLMKLHGGLKFLDKMPFKNSVKVSRFMLKEFAKKL